MTKASYQLMYNKKHLLREKDNYSINQFSDTAKNAVKRMFEDRKLHPEYVPETSYKKYKSQRRK